MNGMGYCMVPGLHKAMFNAASPLVIAQQTHKVPGMPYQFLKGVRGQSTEAHTWYSHPANSALTTNHSSQSIDYQKDHRFCPICMTHTAAGTTGRAADLKTCRRSCAL